MSRVLQKCGYRSFGPLALVFSAATAHAQFIGNVAFFASGQQIGATQPSAVTVTGDVFQQSVWVSYTNGADTHGASGSSTVVRYDTQGRVLANYTVSGSVDGIEENPATHTIWALQNKDGNATVTIISPKFGINPGAPTKFAVDPSNRGYRDVAFFRDQVFLSYTHPVANTDATIQGVLSPDTPLAMGDVLLDGATGINIATNTPNQPTDQSDPGSLRLTPWGGVMLVSSANGQLVFVRNPHTPQQAVGFLNVLDPSGSPVSGVSDALFPLPGQNLFFITNPNTNLVLVVYIFGISPGQLFALVDSMNALVTIDLRTGIAKPLLPNLNGFERMSALQIPGETRP